jgi:hypothetical protein
MQRHGSFWPEAGIALKPGKRSRPGGWPNGKPDPVLVLEHGDP